MTSELWWYTARASGIVSWCLLAAGMIWGLVLSTKARPLGKKPRPNWVLDLHRFLGGATIVFSTIHVVAIMLDSYVDFSPLQVLVPFTSSWRPAAVAWGVVSLYLLAAVEVTSLLRKRLSKRAWHLTHLLSFPLFLFSTIHLLTAGTDASTLPVRAAMVLATTAIVGLTAHRTIGVTRQATSPTTPTTRTRVPAAAATTPRAPDVPDVPVVPELTPAEIGAAAQRTPSVV